MFVFRRILTPRQQGDRAPGSEERPQMADRMDIVSGKAESISHSVTAQRSTVQAAFEAHITRSASAKELSARAMGDGSSIFRNDAPTP